MMRPDIHFTRAADPVFRFQHHYHFRLMAFLDRSAIWTAGEVRDVSDIMILINPIGTPAFSLAKKGKAPNNSVVEWPYETEPDPVATAIADCTDVTESDFADYESYNGMLAGRPHMRRRPVGVGGIANATTRQYGVKGNLFAKNTAKALKALKVDFELVMLGLQDSAVSTSSGKTTYTTRGLGCWVGLTTITDSLTIASAARTPSGSRVNLATAAYTTITEAQVRDVLQSIFDTSRQTADNLVGLCVSTVKRRFADFTTTGTNTDAAALPLRRWNAQQGDTTITLSIDRYVGDFGSVNLQCSHVMPYLQVATASAKSPGLYFIDPDFLEVAMVEPINMTKLENRGGGPRANIQGAIVNKVLNPTRFGVIHRTNAA